MVSRFFIFLNNYRRQRPQFAWLTVAALLLAACGQSEIAATQPSTQPPPPGATPAPQPIEEPGRVEPEFAPPADTEIDILRKPDAVTVAILLPLTGTAASLGRDLLDAAQMAVFDLADANFELRLYDTGGEAQQARMAAENARRDGAQIFLGPLFSDAVLAAAEAARQSNIPVIAFSNNREIAGDGVYAMGFVPEDQVRRIVEYASARGITRFAALAPDDLYGSRMVDALNEATNFSGRELTDVAYYQDDTQVLADKVKQIGRYEERRKALLAQRRVLAARNDEISRRALRRLEELETLGDVDFEAILLPAGSEEVLRLAPLLAFYDIDPSQIRLLGTSLWDDPALLTEPSMAGAWFTAPPADTRRRFAVRFESLYGRAPDRRATLAYDAAALAIVLGQRTARANETSEQMFTTEALTAPSGFNGMDGIFRLHPSGLVERGLAVFEIQRDGVREIDPAPTTFDELTN